MIINENGFDDRTNSIKLLWKNPNPETKFEAGAVELELSGYKMLYVVCLSSTTYKYLMVSPVLNDPSLSAMRIKNDIGMTWSYRPFVVHPTFVYFGEGYYTKISSAGKYSYGNDNTYLIPYLIYGGV